MQRQAEHVLSFLLAELGTQGSIDGQQRLVLKGRFTPKVNGPSSGQLSNAVLQRIAIYSAEPAAELTLTPPPGCPKGVENIIRRYISDYVSCKMCRSDRRTYTVASCHQVQTRGATLAPERC